MQLSKRTIITPREAIITPLKARKPTSDFKNKAQQLRGTTLQLPALWHIPYQMKSLQPFTRPTSSLSLPFSLAVPSPQSGFPSLSFFFPSSSLYSRRALATVFFSFLYYPPDGSSAPFNPSIFSPFPISSRARRFPQAISHLRRTTTTGSNKIRYAGDNLGSRPDCLRATTLLNP
ncbi:hypothetical protein E2C01_096383 [Portunus trituberculatus]|uniref:Uncharacterized protein n=1 Tax=Portunus trituberculatus TaxID=210409 RepID=A0A5B7K6E2_PORTR|nr:hypothetical protein [Portunus trituberculatus]